MKAVRTLRFLLNVSQSELAEAASISSRELARIEKAEVHPTPDTARKIDDALERLIAERLANATT